MKKIRWREGKRVPIRSGLPHYWKVTNEPDPFPRLRPSHDRIRYFQMITIQDVSSEFAQMLYIAGWNPSRRVSIESLCEPLEREGFIANAIAFAILESLANLEIRIPPAGISPYWHELIFDPLHAASGESDRAAGWKDQIGVDLFPLGEVQAGGTVLWVGNDSRFYYGREFGLYFLGDTFKIAMDRLAFPTSEFVACTD